MAMGAIMSQTPNAVQRTGDTMTGPLILSGNPTQNLQATPKQYVDAYTGENRFKQELFKTITLTNSHKQEKVSLGTFPYSDGQPMPMGLYTEVEFNNFGITTSHSQSTQIVACGNVILNCGAYGTFTGVNKIFRMVQYFFGNIIAYINRDENYFSLEDYQPTNDPINNQIQTNATIAGSIIISIYKFYY